MNVTNGNTGMARSVQALWVLVAAEFVALWLLIEQSSHEFVSSSAFPAIMEIDKAVDPDLLGELAMYQSVFSAWLALFLLVPALATFWIRNISEYAWHFWFAHWFVAGLAYLMQVFMNWWRVAATGTDNVLLAVQPEVIVVTSAFFVWWAIDLMFGLFGKASFWIERQRTMLSVLLAVYVLIVFAVGGDIWVSNVLGWTAVSAFALSGLYVWRSTKE